MNGRDLLEGMSYVDDRFVDEAEKGYIGKSRVVWREWISLAACVCVLIAGGFAYGRLHSREDVTPTEAATEAPTQASPVPTEASSVQATDAAIQIPPCSVLVRLESRTEEGFTGTVEEIVEYEVFPAGTQVILVPQEDAVFADLPETMEDLKNRDMEKAYPDGYLVLVEFSDYDEETNTLYVTEMTPVE